MGRRVLAFCLLALRASKAAHPLGVAFFLALEATRAANPLGGSKDLLTFDLLEHDGPPLGGWKMTDAAGAKYECRSGPKKDEEEAAGPETLGAALDLLSGACAYLNQGWWTYEWCHRKQVRQFHLEQRARDPDWSLGGYTGTELEDGDEDEILSLGPEALGRAVDVFDAGGQRCDETGREREARVRFRCCDGDRDQQGASAFLTAVEEVALCEYSVAVCSPALCSASSPNATAALLLRPLEGVCLQRHEGWWSFEFCYKKGCRQFHVETRESSDGRKTARVAAEFSLGDARPGASDDETLVVPAAGPEDQARAEVHFDGGTQCDIGPDGGEPARRATTARLICGDTNALVSVVEDRTCHYVFTVTTPQLCQHAAFAVGPAKRPVACERVSDQIYTYDEPEKPDYVSKILERYQLDEDEDEEEEEERPKPRPRKLSREEVFAELDVDAAVIDKLAGELQKRLRANAQGQGDAAEDDDEEDSRRFQRSDL